MPLILEVLSRSDVETVLAGGGSPALRRAVADFLRSSLEEEEPRHEVAAQTPSKEDPAMKFQCPHCRSNAFRLVTDAAGNSQAECLDCGRVSPFTVSAMLDASGRKRPAKTAPIRRAVSDRRGAD